MTTIVHRAATRGYADHGWLKTYHTFSFADYYDTRRMGFGALRVLNDDQVALAEGFAAHPHANMEIITLVLEGTLLHEDSTGGLQTLGPDEIQVMTAGTGIVHSEFNASEREPVKFLQIWIETDRKGYTPRYERIVPMRPKRNALRLIVAPEGCGSEHVGWIHQTARLYTLNLDEGRVAEYRMNVHGHGAYLFVLEGEAEAAGEALRCRDGVGVREADEFLIKALDNVRLLILEVPV